MRASVIGAAIWSVAGEFVARLVPPAVVALVVRVLPAGDFGVVAAAMVVVGFCQLFWDAALAKALVQTDAAIDDAADVVFWSSLCLSVSAYLLVLATAAPLGRLFDDVRIAEALPWIGAQIVLSALAATFTALLHRRIEFRRIFAARICNAIAAAFVTLLLVYLGYGYRALIGGVLAGSAAQLVVLVIVSDWRPRLRYDWSVAVRLWLFSRWSMLTALLAWFFVFADQLIVGAWLGTEQLGQYGTVSQLVSLSLGLCVAPLLPVLYAALVRMRRQGIDMRLTLQRANRVIAFLIAPLASISIALAGPARELLFGPGWDAVPGLLPPIALGAALSWLAIANNEAYRASGRPKIETQIMLICMALYLAGYLIAIRHGLMVFAWTRCALAGIGLAVHLVFAARYLGASAGQFLRSIAPAAVAGAGTAAVGWLLVQTGWLAPGSRFGLVAAALGLGIVYLAFMPVVARDFLRSELPALLNPRGSGRS